MKKVTSATTAGQLVAVATNELNGVRKAAIAAGKRMQALEETAQAMHAKTLHNCTARVVSTQENGVHALITDAHGTVIEISGGELAASIAKTNP